MNTKFLLTDLSKIKNGQRKIRITRTIKYIIRALIAVIIGIPCLPISYAASTCCGLLLVVPICGLFGIAFFWLVSDKDELENSRCMAGLGIYLLIEPFEFWYLFIIGKNPFKELNV